ncbi:MAG: NAD(+) kinase [Pseudomonadales bacterium]
MKSGFKTVAIVARRQDKSISDIVVVVSEVLTDLGADLIYEDQTAASLAGALGGSLKTVPRSQLAEESDLVVVVGGDGSLLGVSRDIRHRTVPMVGVNRGGLGFLAAVSPELLSEEFGKIWQGEFTLEDHFFLNAEIERGGQLQSTSAALNDVVVQPRNMARMIEFELWVNDEFVYDQKSDGVIFASPTGSTAYSLSAGGPIMHPSLDAIVIVPMFPHTLTSRPLVVRGDATIRLHAMEPVQVSCDSQVVVPIDQGDQLVIRKSEKPLKLLYPKGHSFFESCRSKLDWASRLGGRSKA